METPDQNVSLPMDAAPDSARTGIKRRGFASMSQEQRQQLARLGGKTAHKLGRAHVFTVEEAQAAGRKGGRTISQNSEHMAQIGRNGGNRRWRGSKAKQTEDCDAARAVER